MDTKTVVFKGKKIRKTSHEGEWWFSVVDVIEALTDNVNPRDYWFKMKIREKGESEVELSTICRQLKLKSSDELEKRIRRPIVSRDNFKAASAMARKGLK